MDGTLGPIPDTWTVRMHRALLAEFGKPRWQGEGRIARIRRLSRASMYLCFRLARKPGQRHWEMLEEKT